MLAPTGKAAYIIKGNTIHSALAIPACQSLKTYKRLDSNRLNTLRTQLGGAKLVFIDEISMVGNTMFNVQIDSRLKDIKGSPLPFGDVSIIAIGDLFQLQPVMDDYIFNDLKTEYHGSYNFKQTKNSRTFQGEKLVFKDQCLFSNRHFHPLFYT